MSSTPLAQAQMGFVESVCPEGQQRLSLTVDGRAISVCEGVMVAAALELADPGRGGRISPSGMRRQAFCGMGICGECRVTIDGRPHRLACQVTCGNGMVVRSDD
jgi:predicted molibdopterin-dependent oxidoreductase YjgC